MKTAMVSFLLIALCSSAISLAAGLNDVLARLPIPAGQNNQTFSGIKGDCRSVYVDAFRPGYLQVCIQETSERGGCVVVGRGAIDQTVKRSSEELLMKSADGTKGLWIVSTRTGQFINIRTGFDTFECPFK